MVDTATPRPNRLFPPVFTLALCWATTVASDPLLGGVHPGTYGETTYDFIEGIEVSGRRVFSNYTYDITIPDTQVGQMVLCQLHDSAGEKLDEILDNTRSRETVMNFSIPREAATAVCAYVDTERLTRPSSQP